MFQEESGQINWNEPVYLWDGPPVVLKIYLLFLLLTIVVTITKLISLWIAAPPFRLSRQANNPAYLLRLQTSCNRLKQWMGCTLLGGGIVASTALSNACSRLLEQKAITGSTLTLRIIQDFSVSLSLALFGALFLFLVRWHLFARIEHLRK